MTQEQIVQILEQVMPYDSLVEVAALQMDDYHKAAAAILEAMPKWIPVSERLPEVDSEPGDSIPVLILFNGHTCFGKYERWHNGQCHFYELDTWKLDYDLASPTHWQPLPHASLPGDLK